MKQFEDVLLDLSWKIIESENQRYRDFDTRASSIISIIAFLIGFLLAFKPEDNFSLFFTLTILSFIVTTLLCALVIRTRDSEEMSTSLLIDDFKDKKPEEQIRGIISTAARAEAESRKASDLKAKDLRLAIYSLVISIFLLSLYAISQSF